jgi:nitric oxide synthase oxygenase domain/subunit
MGIVNQLYLGCVGEWGHAHLVDQTPALHRSLFPHCVQAAEAPQLKPLTSVFAPKTMLGIFAKK